MHIFLKLSLPMFSALIAHAESDVASPYSDNFREALAGQRNDYRYRELKPEHLGASVAQKPNTRNPMMNMFLRTFNECVEKNFQDIAPRGCQPLKPITAGGLCHAQGRAIDVFGMKCMGEDGRWVEYWAGNDVGYKNSQWHGRTLNQRPSRGVASAPSKHNVISKLVQCLSGAPTRRGVHSNKGFQMKCLWHFCGVTAKGGGNPTSCHRDHIHCGPGCNGGRSI